VNATKRTNENKEKNERTKKDRTKKEVEVTMFEEKKGENIDTGKRYRE